MSPAGLGTPTGFGGDGVAVKMVGANAAPTTHPARPAPAAQATGRQRREGRWPVGNSSTTNTHSPMPSRKVKPTQLPRVSVRVRGKSKTLKAPTAEARPVADTSQPMG